mgnify:CR=1 FL=1
MSPDIVKEPIEAQVAAIMSHYVYFYLDWLEFDGNYKFDFFNKSKSKNLNKFDENDLSYYRDKQLIDWAPTEAKIMYRIISRIEEILNITERPDRDAIIIDIINETMKGHMAMGFYDLYYRCGYWEYLNEKGLNDIAGECLNWFVCNPKCVYDKNKENPNVTLKEEENNSIYSCYAYEEKKVTAGRIGYMKESLESVKGPHVPYKKICYTPLIKTGLGTRISGFGGLLFVRLSQNRTLADTYIFCTKGTDKNSLNDWLFVDGLQAFTGLSLQHEETVYTAIKIDTSIRNCAPNARLIYVGHSLGGGLATANAIVSPGRHAITFNAASLNFIGVLKTKGVAQLSKLSKKVFVKEKYQTVQFTKTAERVHPIRIKGEAIDVLQIAGRFLTLGTLERGYGQAPLIIDIGTGIKGMGWKHGINNFLYPSVLKRLCIVPKRTRIKSGVAVINQSDISNEFEFEQQPERFLFINLEKKKT